MSRKVKVLTYSAICMALSFVLSHLPLFQMPFGGSVTLLSVFFITLIGYWFGPVAGISSGVAYGFLMLVANPFVVHPAQVLLDYPLASGALGLSGFFRGKNIIVAYLVAVAGKFVFHAISGYIFWYMFAPEGWSPLLYTIAYNASYLSVEAAITIAIISIPTVKAALEKVKNNI